MVQGNSQVLLYFRRTEDAPSHLDWWYRLEDLCAARIHLLPGGRNQRINGYGERYGVTITLDTMVDKDERNFWKDLHFQQKREKEIIHDYVQENIIKCYNVNRIPDVAWDGQLVWYRQVEPVLDYTISVRYLIRHKLRKEQSMCRLHHMRLMRQLWHDVPQFGGHLKAYPAIRIISLFLDPGTHICFPSLNFVHDVPENRLYLRLRHYRAAEMQSS